MDDKLFYIMQWALNNSSLKEMKAKFAENEKEHYTLIGEAKAYITIVEKISKITGHGKPENKKENIRNINPDYWHNKVSRM